MIRSARWLRQLRLAGCAVLAFAGCARDSRELARQRALTAEMEGRSDLARRFWGEVVRAAPDDLAALRSEAIAWLRGSQISTSEGLARLDRYLDRVPEDDLARREGVAARLLSGSWAAALAEARKLPDGEAETHALRARALVAGDPRAARAEIERALTLAPDLPAYQLVAAEIAYELGDLAAVDEHARRALAAGPTRLKAAYLLGRSALHRGYRESAEHWLEMHRLVRAITGEGSSAEPPPRQGLELLAALAARLEATAPALGLEATPPDPRPEATAPALGLEATLPALGLEATAPALGLEATAPALGLEATAPALGLEATPPDPRLGATAPNPGLGATAPDLELRRAQWLLVSGELGEAESIARELAPRLALAELGELGRAVYAARRSRLARELFERARGLAPRDPGAVTSLALLDLDEGAAEAARARLAELLAGRGEDEPCGRCEVLMARAELRLGHDAEALERLRRAVRWAPWKRDWAEELAQRLKTLGRERERDRVLADLARFQEIPATR